MKINYEMEDKFTLETLSDYIQIMKSNGFKPISWFIKGSRNVECNFENKEAKCYISIDNDNISFEGFAPEEALNFYQIAVRCSEIQEPEYPDIEDDEIDR